MRAPRTFSALLGVVALAGAAFAQSDFKSRVLELLPQSGQVAEVLEWGHDPEVRSIQQRVQEAIRLDPRWYREYVTAYAGNAQLPWHPKLGVTRDEYARYVTEGTMRLQRTGRTARVNYTKSGNRVVFQGGPGAEALRGLILDLVTGELRVPEGFTAKPHQVNLGLRDDQIGLGARKGYGWYVEGTNVNTRTMVVANLSLLEFNTGEVLLSYNRVSAVGGQRNPSVDLNLLYDNR